MEEKELVKLIDKYLDEALSVEETEEFNDLLENSRAFRDMFRSRVKLHADLVSHYDSVEMPIIPFEPIKRSNSKSFAVILTLAAALVISLVLPNTERGQQSPVLASLLVNNSKGLMSRGLLVDGESLGSGEYSFAKGLIEFEMPNDVTVAIEGPAAFSLLSTRKMRLTNGKVSAHVGEAGKGFIVETPDGNIIDLGTRFGVSVTEQGKTEAHVFQGKINVVADAKTTELTKDEAIEIDDGREVKRLNADLARFPLPGFPLEVNFENESFEGEDNLKVGWPTEAGHWGGDHCELVSSLDDVKTAEGQQMLRFVKPYAKGAKDEGQKVSQLWQLLDLRAYKDEIARGGVSARLSTSLNTSENASETSFSISMYAFTGNIKDIKSYWDNKNDPLSELLGGSTSSLKTDYDSTSWEKIECQLSIPPGTTFLKIQLSAKTESFSGHFADACKFEINNEARKSLPIAVWKGNGGLWGDKNNWQSGKLPDYSHESIRLKGKEKILLDTEVTLKQSLTLALNRDAEAHLKILKLGILSMASNGELLVGYNEGGRATIEVEGTLITRKKAFIGRNNSVSKVILHGGLWDAKGTTIRMSQYGKREESTQSLLEIRNGGRLQADTLNMINDDSVLEIVDGQVELEMLRVAGKDGSATVNHHAGLLKTDQISFGSVPGIYYFAGSEAELALKGTWTVERLLNIENSNWHFQGRPLTADELKAEEKEFEGEPYTVFSLK